VFRAQGSELRVQVSGCCVAPPSPDKFTAGFRVWGSGFRVQGAGCRAQNSGLRFQDIALGAETPFSHAHHSRGDAHTRFRGGLVFKAHRLLNHSTLSSRVTKKKRSDEHARGQAWHRQSGESSQQMCMLRIRWATKRKECGVARGRLPTSRLV